MNPFLVISIFQSFLTFFPKILFGSNLPLTLHRTARLFLGLEFPIQRPPSSISTLYAMDSSITLYLYITLVAVLNLTIGYVDRVKKQRGKNPSVLYKSARFHDIGPAIDFMQKSLPDNMSKEERCEICGFLGYSFERGITFRQHGAI